MYIVPVAARLKNVTITLDHKTADWLRVAAAERGISASRYVSELLQSRMTDLRKYNDAMRRFFAAKPLRFEWVDGRRPTRGELHDRGRVR